MQFKSIWLSTVLSVVATVVCCQTFAADNAASCGIPDVPAFCTDNPRLEGGSFEKCVRSYARICAGGAGATTDPNDCSTLERELTKESGEFSRACNEVGRAGESCDRAFNGCTNCSFADGEAEGDSCDDDTGDAAAERGARRRGAPSALSSFNLASPQNYSVRTEREPVPYAQFGACPSIALNQIKEVAAELKEIREDVSKLKTDIEQKKQDVIDTEGKITTANQDYEKEKNEREAKYETDLTELTGTLDAEAKVIRENQTKAQNDLVTLEASRSKLLAQYIEQIAGIEDVCAQEAERELAKRREDYIKQLQGSRAVQKDIASLLKLRLRGRSNDDEAFRKRAILRCQQNPARYQRPVALLNNQYEIKKSDLETAIKQKRDEILTLQTQFEEKQTNSPKAQENLRKLFERKEKDLLVLKTARDSTVGTCGMAPTSLGENATQNGARNCSGLMKSLNSQQQSQQRLEAELAEKEADLRYTQELYDAAKDATGGNTSGPAAAEDVSTAGGGVLSVLETLYQRCSAENPGKSQNWKAQIRRMTGRDPDPPIDQTISPSGAAVTSGGAGATTGGSSATSGGTGGSSASGTGDAAQ